MRRLYTLEVSGEPVGKGRPRVTSRGTFTPQATRDGEARIKALSRAAWGPPRPHDGPWSLVVTFHRGERRPRDLDNLAKLVMDALEGVLWTNDRHIHHLDASVVWLPKGQTGYTTIQASRPQTPEETSPA